MKATSLPSCSIDLCSVFLKDQFTFVLTGNESATIIIQVVVVPSILFTGVISPKRASEKLNFLKMMCSLEFSITGTEEDLYILNARSLYLVVSV